MKIYEVVPNILSAGRSTPIRIRQLVSSRAPGWGGANAGATIVEIIERKNYRTRAVLQPRFIHEDGGATAIEVDFQPERPGEYIIHVNISGKRWPAESLVDLRCFVVPTELFRLRPWKGDMHMHTYWSDGDQSPAVMAARCRQQGLDFAAITDHRHWESSIEAAEKAKEHGFDILMIPGEECNYVIGLGHVLCYGAREGVSSRLLAGSPFSAWKDVDDESKFERLLAWAYPQVEEEVRNVRLPDGVDRRAFGFYAFIVREIHRSGGIAVAAHPYWVSQRVVDLITPLYEQVLAHRLVDAFELFGAVDFEDNILSLVRLLEERTKGNNLPFWVNSDSHDVDFPTFGRQFTVAFTEKREQQAIFDAILSGRATGCLHLGDGKTIVIGEQFLVEYTYFLLREVLPEHDELCRMMGDLYQLKLQGAPGLPDHIKALHREAVVLRERHWNGAGT